MKYIVILLVSIVINSSAVAVDVTIWFGNTDNEPLIVRNNSLVKVPVWIYTTPGIEVAAVHIPLSTDDRFVSERQEPEIYKPFNKELEPPEGYDKGWDVASTLDPMPHEGKDHFTSQSFLGFCDLTRKPNVYLACPDTCKVLLFPMIVSVADSLVGSAHDILIEGFQGNSRGFHFSDPTGGVTFEHEALFSNVYIVNVGDVNDDRKIDEEDIKHLEDYFEGKRAIPWPIERADCNNDQVVAPDDIDCLRELLD